MENYDVVIAGGGPVGALVGRRVGAKGFDVLILEEHQQVGKPVQCAGLVSQRTIDWARLKKTDDVVLNVIYGVRFVSPGGYELEIESDKAKAVVIDRTAFDRSMMKNALDSGCDVRLRSRFMRAKRKGDGLSVEYREGDILKSVDTKLLVGADGAQSAVRRTFGFPEPSEFLSGFEVELENLKMEENIVHVFLGRDVAPGFFLWAIPCGGTVRVGLCSTDGFAYSNLQKFLGSNQANFLDVGKPLHLMAGSIPIGFMKRTVADNVLIVGDAAAQVKPLSGGGLYPGLECARICGQVVVESLENGDYSADFLKRYQNRWQKGIGKEIRNGLKFRKLFLRLKDEQLDELTRTLDRDDLRETIGKYGDIDYPSKLTQPLLKKAPLLLIFATPFLKGLF